MMSDNQQPVEYSEKISFLTLKKFFNDPLSKNAVILLMTWFMNAAVGFIFILLAAKNYSVDIVGIAMLLIAYSNIVILVSRFGIEQSMIRYHNDYNKSLIFFTAVIITTILAVIIGILVLIMSFTGFLGQDILTNYAGIFLLGVCLLSVCEVCGFFFLAYGKPELYFMQSVVTGTRLVFLILFISMGVFGLFSSLIVAIGLSVVFSLPFVYHLGAKQFAIGKMFLLDSLHFSVGNYISDFFLTTPVFFLPIMVYLLFDQRATALYSVAYAVASIAFLIPSSIGYATFISGCRNNNSDKSIHTIILPTLALIIAIISVFFIWGQSIVGFFGPDYSGTSGIITTIMTASIFALFFQIYTANFRIQNRIKELILFNMVLFFLLLTMSYYFMIYFGLIGVGYAWIGSYAVCVIAVAGYSFLKKYLAV